MEWDKLKVFYHIALSESISQAAKTLNTSQSALSRTLQLFEDRINTKLFYRQPRGIILTKPGLILFRKVQIMMEAAEEAKSLLEEEEIEQKGLLKIATTHGITSFFLSPGIPSFLKQYPELRLDIFSKDNLYDIKDLEVDAYIVPHHIYDKNLIEHHKARFHFRLYASPGYIKKRGIPKKIEDLDNHLLIGAGSEKIDPLMFADWHLAIGKPKGVLREAYIYINNTESRCFFAQHDLGIISTSPNMPGLKNFGLIEILPQVEGPVIDVYCSYPAAFRNSKKIKILDNFLDTIFVNNK